MGFPLSPWRRGAFFCVVVGRVRGFVVQVAEVFPWGEGGKISSNKEVS